MRANTFYQSVSKQDSLQRRDLHSVTSSFRSGQVQVHVQVRQGNAQRAEAGGGGGGGAGGDGGGAAGGGGGGGAGGGGGGPSAGGRFLRGLGPCLRDQDEDEDYAHKLRAMLTRYLPQDLVSSKRIDDLIRVRICARSHNVYILLFDIGLLNY